MLKDDVIIVDRVKSFNDLWRYLCHRSGRGFDVDGDVAEDV